MTIRSRLEEEARRKTKKKKEGTFPPISLSPLLPPKKRGTEFNEYNPPSLLKVRQLAPCIIEDNIISKV